MVAVKYWPKSEDSKEQAKDQSKDNQIYKYTKTYQDLAKLKNDFETSFNEADLKKFLIFILTKNLISWNYKQVFLMIINLT